MRTAAVAEPDQSEDAKRGWRVTKVVVIADRFGSACMPTWRRCRSAIAQICTRMGILHPGSESRATSASFAVEVRTVPGRFIVMIAQEILLRSQEFEWVILARHKPGHFANHDRRCQHFVACHWRAGCIPQGATTAVGTKVLKHKGRRDSQGSSRRNTRQRRYSRT